MSSISFFSIHSLADGFPILLDAFKVTRRSTGREHQAQSCKALGLGLQSFLGLVYYLNIILNELSFLESARYNGESVGLIVIQI